jgi:hypothetical protein
MNDTNSTSSSSPSASENPHPLVYPSAEELCALWTQHYTIGERVEDILHKMHVPPLHFFACAAINPDLHRLFLLRETVENYGLLDSYRHDAIHNHDASPADRSRAVLDFQRVTRTISAHADALATLLPKPGPLPKPEAQPETDEDRYLASTAEFRDENGVPINMNHPVIIDAAIDAMIDSRRRLENAARERIYLERHPERAIKPIEASQPPTDGPNLEIPPPDPTPTGPDLTNPVETPDPRADNKAIEARLRATTRLWFIARTGPNPPHFDPSQPRPQQPGAADLN